MEHDWLSSSSVWLIEPCVLEKVKPSAVLCCVVTRCLVHLSRGKAEVGMFAPDKNQMHVINHLTGSPAEGQSRYVSVCLHNRIICWWENLPWINQGFLWVSVGLQNVSSGTRHFPMSCVMPSCVLCVCSSVSLSLSLCVCLPGSCLQWIACICVTRNVLVESARIARGNIKPLSQLSASQFDAVVFPGGFGAAKNLYVAFLYTNSWCMLVS